MAAAAGGETRAGIGSRLRAAREKKGLTLLQAAEKMHVDSRILESLEAEDFAALGAPVYARGHLRHYAELVDESPTELHALYAEATKAQPALPDLTRIARGEPMDDSRRLAGPALIGVIAVAVVGSVWWIINLSGESVRPASVQSAPAGSSAAAPAAGPEGEDTNTTSQSEADNQSPASQPAPAVPRGQPPTSKLAAKSAAATPGGPSPNTPASAPRPGSASAGRSGAAVAGTAPGGTRPNATAGAATAPAAASAVPANTRVAAATPAANIPATAPNPAPRAKDGELTLRFSSDSWAEVYDASGQRLFYDVGTASSAHTVKGPAPLRVVLGNASGVAVEYNGRPALIPAGNQPDGSARFVINAHGRAVPASAAAAPNGD